LSIEPSIDGFQVLDKIEGFDRVTKAEGFRVKILTSTKMYIHKRKI
jgi:hypothetical protein